DDGPEDGLAVGGVDDRRQLDSLLVLVGDAAGIGREPEAEELEEEVLEESDEVLEDGLGEMELLVRLRKVRLLRCAAPTLVPVVGFRTVRRSPRLVRVLSNRQVGLAW